VEVAWRREAEALKKVRSLNHHHLVCLVAAFKRSGTHFIALEWAEGGNLREFWKMRDATGKELDKDEVLQYLQQLLGLTDALKTLHRLELFPRKSTAEEVTEQLNVPTSVSRATIQHPESSTDPLNGRNMRHGDLKPENILNFGKEAACLGRLKISDLGLAKEHDDKTKVRMDTTKTVHGTIRYEAPEVHKLINKEKGRSRRYDTWSMGCIIFESVIWLLYGQKGLVAFWENEASIEAPKRDSLYFATDGYPPTSAHVSEYVSSWMEHMIQEQKQENSGQSSPMIEDLLTLVQDKLLVVDLSERGRIYADDLHAEMQKIFQNANRDSAYVFSGRRLQIPHVLRKVTHDDVLATAPTSGQRLEIPTSRDPKVSYV